MESLGLKPSKTELQDIVNEIDVDQSGTISFDGTVPFPRRDKHTLGGEYTKVSCLG